MSELVEMTWRHRVTPDHAGLDNVSVSGLFPFKIYTDHFILLCL